MRRQKELRRSLWEKFLRLLKYRLVFPTIRSKLSPEQTARGTLIGLAWAFTPLVGIQMIMCTLTWLIADKIFKWKFSLAVSCAWTWVTNVFTTLPCYYIFYRTGHFMLGYTKRTADYSSFIRIFKRSFADGLGFWETLKVSGAVLFKDWGLAMSVGCIPYVVIFSCLGYYYVLKYLRNRQARRGRRQSRPEEKKEKDANTPPE